MGDQVMARMRRPISAIGVMITFFVFLLAGVLSFSPAYGGPETIGASPAAQSRVRAPRDADVGVEQEMEEDTGKPDDDADVVEMATNEQFLPVGIGEVNSLAQEATAFRQKSGFDAFNARYQNKWAATFSRETGTVRVLYGAKSRQYKNGPEGVARGFLKDSYALFGLKQNLIDLTTRQVDRTPQRDHVRMQQTYNGVPIVGALVLVHATPQGRVTMVQNDYQQGLQPANRQVIPEEAAKQSARTDLQASLGEAAILAEPKAEQWIAPYKDGYYYIWQVAISTQNPLGFWVYHIDVASGAILYKANEVFSLRSGKGRAYKSNADWWLSKISAVTLSNMYTIKEGNTGPYLYGVHADIWDYLGSDPKPPDYKYLYDPLREPLWFDATHAYYQMNTVWNWWNTKVMRRFYNKLRPAPAGFSTTSVKATVNVVDLCNAFYDPGTNSLIFGNQGACLTDTDGFYNEDFVIDNDVLRHEYTHAMMTWAGFIDQFGGEVDGYGRAMGEGNADWFAFLNTPTDPLMGDVCFNETATGYIRDLDNTRMYPWDVDFPMYPIPVPEEHWTGEIWGGYLYDLYRVLKSSALSYVYHSFFYFNTRGGNRGDGFADFFDGIQAQMLAERDLTGRQTKTARAWGSMASRGINAFLRNSYYAASGDRYRAYYHPTNYFGTLAEGFDLPATLFWYFSPSRSLKTQGNILLSGDEHEYPIWVTTKGLDLTVTVTATPGGAVNPEIQLWDISVLPPGGMIASVLPSTPTTAVLTYPDLPYGGFIIVVTGDNTDLARGYYDITMTLK